MRVLVGQVAPIIGDVSGNLALCREALADGVARRADVVVLPELVLTGYPPRDLLDHDALIDGCMDAARKLAAETAACGQLVLVFGTPWRDDGGLRNAAVVAHKGQIVAVVRKSLLPSYDVFDEDRWFIAERDPRPVEVAGLTLGVTICEDLWNEPAYVPPHRYTVDPIACMTGCDLVVNLSASPFHAGKGATRLGLVRAQAAQAGAPLVYANMVGGNDELLFDGHSLVVRADGTLVGQGRAFAPDAICCDLDGPAVEFAAQGFEAEAHAALVMGIRDYATRCGFHSAVLGLSGGIDSALTAVLAAHALGPENVHCVGMPGPFSSEHSVADARALAENLGCPFQLVGIDGIYDAALAALAPAFAGVARDVTEENVQSRARGMVLMALSNKFGHLLLNTGNKSELAVGYCTLYGDMNGGLGVLSDVYKIDVYRISRWLNRDAEVIPWNTIDKPPSAELAPDQKDQDSLPPYSVLDAILRASIEDRLAVEDIVALGHDTAVVERVLRLVSRNEYKRWQAPPGLRISPKAFGMGRRIPLAKRWRPRADQD